MDEVDAFAIEGKEMRRLQAFWIALLLVASPGCGGGGGGGGGNQGGTNPTPVPAASPTPGTSPTVSAGCGSGATCGCGDTLAGTYTLTADLDCDGAGITVTSGSVLDCAQHTITGRGGDNSDFGIYVFQAIGAVVRNCRVTGFRRGVRIDQGSGNRIENVEAFANGDPVSHRQGGYGIDVGSSTDNVIDTANAHDNADEGIHIGGGSDRTTVTNTLATNNYREQLYVLSNSGTVLSNNTLESSGETNSAALFLKQVTNGRLQNAMVRGANITIRGSTSGAQLEQIEASNSGIRFEADESGSPSDNVVATLHVTHAFECVHGQSSGRNLVRDSTFDSCDTDVVATGTVNAPTDLTLIGSTLPAGTFNLDENSTLDIGWHLEIDVQDGRAVTVGYVPPPPAQPAPAAIREEGLVPPAGPP